MDTEEALNKIFENLVSSTRLNLLLDVKFTDEEAEDYIVSKPFAAAWSAEIAEDLLNIHNIDIMDEMVSCLGSQLEIEYARWYIQQLISNYISLPKPLKVHDNPAEAINSFLENRTGRQVIVSIDVLKQLDLAELEPFNANGDLLNMTPYTYKDNIILVDNMGAPGSSYAIVLPKDKDTLYIKSIAKSSTDDDDDNTFMPRIRFASTHKFDCSEVIDQCYFSSSQFK